MSDVAIKVENLSKLYKLGEVGTGTISHDLNRWWHKVRGKEDPYAKIGSSNDRSVADDSQYAWALKDISFEVKKGEVLGIIGKNGAGKSTLLKLLSQITSPTSGTVKARGRIASLLEVGTGFYPELTGRENIFLNGAILGMTKQEIRSKFDEIVDFSGCAKYVDTPVKRYSSGMMVRLGFAVAAFLEPEILIVDEVLAVGDAEFQKKAIGKMQDVSKEGGRTVLFVSHNMSSVTRLCSKAMLLMNGEKINDGKTAEVIQYYLNLNSDAVQASLPSISYKENDSMSVQICQVRLMSEKTSYSLFEEIEVEVVYEVKEEISGVSLGIDLSRNDDLLFRFFDTDRNYELMSNRKLGKYRAVLKIPNILKSGSYQLDIHTSKPNGGYIDRPEDKLAFDILEDNHDVIFKSFASKRGGVIISNLAYDCNKIK